MYRLVFDDVFEAADECADIGSCPFYKPMISENEGHQVWD